MFVLGVAAGTMLPVRHWMHRLSAGRFARPDSQAARDAEMVWRRAGNPDVRHPVDVIRTIDGDTFEARVHLPPGLDLTTRVRLRGIDAPELKAACPQELQMAEAATAALRALLGEGDVRIFNIGPDKYGGRVVADVATRRRPRMFRPRCSPQVMRAATAAAIAAAGARTQANRLRNEKAAQSRGFSNLFCNQRVTVTVVPTETR